MGGSKLDVPLVTLNTGYKMPIVLFGTYKITGQDAIDLAVDTALDAGYRGFDTAKYYKNEAEIGNALEKFLPKYDLKREDIFLITKFPPASNTEATGADRLIQESLENFKTSYLDLVYVHYPKADERANDDPENFANRRDAYLALAKLKDSGKIRSIGVSNFVLRHFQEIPKYSSVVPAATQLEYHPHFTRNDIRKYCKEQGIYFQAFSSLGRHHPDLIGDPVVAEISQKHGVNPETVLLAFPLSQGIGIVPKSSNPDRIRENFNAIRFKLSQEEIEKLNARDKNKYYISRAHGWEVL
uniref:NADP-dependent oxidoreductase domain-containing protein n=1 Tax=Acrobeloides nanus TaxID=290746 RepID=A0A914DL88_9BILA